MPANPFAPFDPVQIYAQAEAIKSARSNRAMDELQAKYLGERVQTDRMQVEQQGQEQLRKAALENAVGGFSAIALSDDPERTAAEVFADQRFIQSNKVIGIPIEQFTPDGMNPELYRSSSADMVRRLGGTLKTGQGAEQPSAVAAREHLWKGFTPEEQEHARRVEAGIASRASPGRFIKIGNVMHHVDDLGNVIQSTPLGTIEQEASGAAAVAGAEAGAKVTGTASAEDLTRAPKRLAAANATISDIENNLMPVFDKLSNQASGWTVGLMAMAQVPGSPAADLQANLQTIFSSAAFDRLQEMRDNSETGGALGSITEREIDLLAATRASLETSQSPEQFRENLQRFRGHYQRVLELSKQAKQVDSLKTQLVQLQRRPAGAERDSRLQRVQERIATIEDQWWDSLEAGGDEAAPTAAAAPAGTPAAPTAAPQRVRVDAEGNVIGGP